MTISQSDPQIGRERFAVVDVDPRDDSRRCPVCGRSLGPEARTVDVPPSLLDDATRDVSARAFVCGRHRVDIVALEPAAAAPDLVAAVDAQIDGETIRLAVPEELEGSA